jgi:hypothetical protein
MLWWEGTDAMYCHVFCLLGSPSLAGNVNLYKFYCIKAANYHTEPTTAAV